MTMPPSADDFKKRIQGIVKRVQPLPDEAKAPILHYRRTIAVKLRVWVKGAVDAPTILSPIKSDLHWLKTFLDDTAEECNRRIGLRLAALLTTIHAEAPSLFVPADMANRLTGLFQSCVAGRRGQRCPPAVNDAS